MVLIEASPAESHEDRSHLVRDTCHPWTPSSYRSQSPRRYNHNRTSQNCPRPRSCSTASSLCINISAKSLFCAIARGHISQTSEHISHTRGHISQTSEHISHTRGHISQTSEHISHTSGYISHIYLIEMVNVNRNVVVHHQSNY